ncbi:MAG: hypothetical protein R2856_12940 [Caldilineaceae bacterium]
MTTVRTTQVDRSATRIDFGIGQPGFDLLPHDILASAAALRRRGQRSAQLRLRARGRALPSGAGRFSTHPPTPPPSPRTTVDDHDEASQALDLICTQFTRPATPCLWRNRVALPGAAYPQEDKLNVVVDEDGLLVDAWKRH